MPSVSGSLDRPKVSVMQVCVAVEEGLSGGEAGMMLDCGEGMGIMSSRRTLYIFVARSWNWDGRSGGEIGLEYGRVEMLIVRILVCLFRVAWWAWLGRGSLLWTQGGERTYHEAQPCC